MVEQEGETTAAGEEFLSSLSSSPFPRFSSEPTGCSTNQRELHVSLILQMHAQQRVLSSLFGEAAVLSFQSVVVEKSSSKPCKTETIHCINIQTVRGKNSYDVDFFLALSI